MDEIKWIDAIGFEGLYVVSNYGSVKSTDRLVIRRNGRPLKVKGKELKFRINDDGYYQVQLNKDGKKYCPLVHRLVWESFYGRVPNGLEIAHVDENQKNNYLGNLLLCTHKENCNMPLFRKRKSEFMKGNSFSKGNVSKFRKKVVCLDLDWKLVKEYDSLCEVKKDGFSIGNVCSCCRNKYGKDLNVTKNMRFQFKDEYEKMLGQPS